MGARPPHTPPSLLGLPNAPRGPAVSGPCCPCRPTQAAEQAALGPPWPPHAAASPAPSRPWRSASVTARRPGSEALRALGRRVRGPRGGGRRRLGPGAHLRLWSDRPAALGCRKVRSWELPRAEPGALWLTRGKGAQRSAGAWTPGHVACGGCVAWEAPLLPSTSVSCCCPMTWPVWPQPPATPHVSGPSGGRWACTPPCLPGHRPGHAAPRPEGPTGPALGSLPRGRRRGNDSRGSRWPQWQWQRGAGPGPRLLAPARCPGTAACAPASGQPAGRLLGLRPPPRPCTLHLLLGDRSS